MIIKIIKRYHVLSALRCINSHNCLYLILYAVYANDCIYFYTKLNTKLFTAQELMIKINMLVKPKFYDIFI